MAKRAVGEGDSKSANRYSAILSHIFFRHYAAGCKSFEWERTEFEEAARALRIKLPKNLGDILYSVRFRTPLPPEVIATAEKGRQWVIELAGHGKYSFCQRIVNRIIPSENAYQIKIPDATPEIINMYAKTDEQALLAKVRYNRLIDIFLRITAYSMQSHLRTSVPNIGQIEVDELYVGVRNTGQQFIVPVQAKAGKDQIGAHQVRQDLELCKHAFPALTARAVAVQFMDRDVIAMFELAFQGEALKVVDERQYRLVTGSEISGDDLQSMAKIS